MKKNSFEISGNIVDVNNRKIFPGTVVVIEGVVAEIRQERVNDQHYILPGLIDAHVHIESSMLVPAEFARLAVVHGTTATVSDPHEIANVLGMQGVDVQQQFSRQGLVFPLHHGFTRWLHRCGFAVGSNAKRFQATGVFFVIGKSKKTERTLITRHTGDQQIVVFAGGKVSPAGL